MPFGNYFPGSANFGGVRSGNADYATARTGGTLASYTRVGQYGTSPYYCYESFVEVDTSAIPNDAIIDAVYLYVNVSTDNTTTDFDLQARIYDYGDAVATGDWVSGADISALPLLGSCSTAAPFTTGGYFFALTGGDPTLVNLAGNTRLLLCSSRHVAGTTPTGAEYFVFSAAPGLFVQWHLPDPAGLCWWELERPLGDQSIEFYDPATVTWDNTKQQMNAADFDNATFFFDVTWLQGDSSNARTVTLYDVTNSADLVTITLPGRGQGTESPWSSALARYGVIRAQFTPPEGDVVYRVKTSTATNLQRPAASRSRIVVRQVEPTKAEFCIPLVSDDTPPVANATTVIFQSIDAAYAATGNNKDYCHRFVKGGFATLAAGTPWRLEVITRGAGNTVALLNVTDGAAVAASEIACGDGAYAFTSLAFADDAANWHDGDEFIFAQKKAGAGDVYVQHAALYVKVASIQDAELFTRLGFPTTGTAAVTSNASKAEIASGGLSDVATVADYHEVTGACADDAVAVYLRELTDQWVTTGTDRGGVNFNSATIARQRVEVTGLADKAYVTAYRPATTNAKNSVSSYLVRKINGLAYGPTWGANSITINAGAASTDDNDVTLTLSASAMMNGSPVTIDQMCFSDDGVTYGAWEDYATTRAYQLPAQTDADPHTCTVYAKFRVTEDGEDYDSAAVSDSIDLEVGWTTSIAINSGVAVIFSPSVVLDIAAASSAGAVLQMRFSDDGTTWGAWEAYATSRAYTLAGTTTGPSVNSTYYVVYVDFKDADGNTTEDMDTAELTQGTIVYKDARTVSNVMPPVYAVA